MTQNECCGLRPREVSIDLSHATVTMLFCGRCERRQWVQDGTPVALTAVTEAATRTWNRRLVAA